MAEQENWHLIPYEFALHERECRTCEGTGLVKKPWGDYEDCFTCWGYGKVEVQRGPKDPHGEVPYRPDLGSIRAAVAGWKANRESQS